MAARRRKAWVYPVGSGCLLAAMAAVALAVPAIKVEPFCPVSEQPCDPKVSLDFHAGRIWFCGRECKQTFEDDPAPYTAAAHHQMVLLRQFVQRACPLEGAPVAAGTKLDIGGVEVGFCSAACRSRVEKAAVADQLQLVFGNLGRGFVSIKAVSPRR